MAAHMGLTRIPHMRRLHEEPPVDPLRLLNPSTRLQPKRAEPVRRQIAKERDRRKLITPRLRLPAQQDQVAQAPHRAGTDAMSDRRLRRHMILQHGGGFVITPENRVITNVEKSAKSLPCGIISLQPSTASRPIPRKIKAVPGQPRMNIHEYQAKALLRSYGAPVSDGRVVLRSEDAKTAASALDGPLWVVKAQIHAGGRGKGHFLEEDAGEKGGVRLTKSVEEAEMEAKRMLGRTLVTKQTGPEGKRVGRIYIEDGSGIAQEFYLALLVDRSTSRVSFVASTEGGMDIEEVAESTPEKILSFSVDPATGYQPFHGRRIGFMLGLSGKALKQCVNLMGTLYTMFVEKDMEMLEINPLILTDAGDLKCLDAKMGFDGNAIYRHPDIAELRDETEEDPKELAASQHDLNYIALDGEIGCMVNGAGLAMATMDIINLYGAQPANFLDVGGSATKDKVTEAFKIITSDPNVKGILVNIFGGIMRCDVIAEGVIAAVKEVGLKVPLVVRLEGTNVDKGKEIISNSGLDVIAADNLKDGAEKIVKAVKG
jgi:succinyl-CoA synthetase beta subunit